MLLVQCLRKPLLLATALCVLLGAGCAKMPTESQTVVDDRPAITFKLLSKDKPKRYEVYVDNLPVGSLEQYQSGEASLRVTPGAHIIRVSKGGAVVYEAKVYLGDGATKEILVK